MPDFPTGSSSFTMNRSSETPPRSTPDAVGCIIGTRGEEPSVSDKFRPVEPALKALLDLPHPLAQRFGGTAQLSGDGADDHPPRRALVGRLADQAFRPLPDLR